MSDPNFEDRLLEANLSRVLQEPHSSERAAELAARVQRALQERRGNPLEDLPQVESAPAPHLPRRVPIERILLSAAALAAIASLVPRFVSTEKPTAENPTRTAGSEAPVERLLLAQATRPVTTLAGLATDQLALGDVVYVDPAGDPLALQLAEQTYTLTPGSLFGLVDERTLELALGSLHAEGPSLTGDGWQVAVDRLRIDPNPVESLRLDVESTAMAAAVAADASAVWDQRDIWSREAGVVAQMGYLYLNWDGVREELFDGDRRRLALGAGELRTLDDDQRLNSLLDRLVEFTDRLPLNMRATRVNWTGMWSETWYARTEMAGLLARAPEGWAGLEPRLKKILLTTYGNAALSDMTLAMICRDTSEASADIARRLWKARPEIFANDAILALAERELFEFEREMEAMVEFAPNEEERRLAAVFWSLRGSEKATELLQRGIEEVPTPKLDFNLGAQLALVCLARTGEEEPWLNFLQTSRDEAIGLLDRGNFESAEMQVLHLDFLHELLVAAETPSLAYLGLRLADYTVAVADRYPSEVELLQRLYELEEAR